MFTSLEFGFYNHLLHGHWTMPTPRLLAANSGFAPGHHAIRRLTERLGSCSQAQREELTTRLARQKGKRRYPETWEAWSLGCRSNMVAELPSGYLNMVIFPSIMVDLPISTISTMGLGKLHHDLTVLPHWKSWFILGKSSPFMAASFRLVNYYNLHRWSPNCKLR